MSVALLIEEGSGTQGSRHSLTAMSRPCNFFVFPIARPAWHPSDSPLRATLREALRLCIPTCPFAVASFADACAPAYSAPSRYIVT